MSENILAKNLKIISYKELPEEIGKSLRLEQRDCLNFAVKKFKVIGEPKIQTFQTGSTIKGQGIISGGGASYALASNWNVFGGLGTIGLNQDAIHSFRTDLNLRLQEMDNQETVFLEKSIPLPITASLSSGDNIEVYFARGGFSAPLMKNDFQLNDWAPFFLKNMETGQIIPISALPSMLRPVYKMTAGKIAALIFGILFFIPSFSVDDEGAKILGFTIAFFLFLPSIIVSIRESNSKQKGLVAYKMAKEEAIAYELKNKST